MTRFFSILLIVTINISLFSQEPEYLALVKEEAQLQDLFNLLYSDSLSDVEPILDSVGNRMKDALSMEGSLDFPWSRLDKIGIITSEDGVVRVYSWHVMDGPDQFRYFGYIQVEMKKGGSMLYELRDNRKPQRGIMKLDQSYKDWYGKLYYQVLTNRYKRKTYYTLLGVDFNNSRSTIKCAEVISIQRNEPQFVKSLFFNGRDFVDRLVLEYSKQVAISLRYDPGTEMITFDHLVPFHPIYANSFEFYGPDGSIDGLGFDAGRWLFQIDIDARNID